MIFRVKANCQIVNYPENIPNEFTGDVEILKLHCINCGEDWYKIDIKEHRPLLEQDYKYPLLVLCYATPSPRGKLGERYITNIYDNFKTYLFGSEYRVFILPRKIDIKFLKGQRHFNSELWNVINVIHIYEDHYNADICWVDTNEFYKEISLMDIVNSQNVTHRKCRTIKVENA